MNQKVHNIVHPVGGLVCRNMIDQCWRKKNVLPKENESLESEVAGTARQQFCQYGSMRIRLTAVMWYV